MPALKNPKHERFAQLVAEDVPKVEAYREALRSKASSASVNASQLLRLPQVSLRIDELRALADDALRHATTRRIEEKASETADSVARIVGKALTQAELLAFVTNIVLAKPSDLNGGDSMLVESIKPGKYGDTLEVCDKLRAAELAAKLQGFLIEKVEATVDDKRVKSPDERARLLRESIARRQGTHGRS